MFFSHPYWHILFIDTQIEVLREQLRNIDTRQMGEQIIKRIEELKQEKIDIYEQLKSKNNNTL